MAAVQKGGGLAAVGDWHLLATAVAAAAVGEDCCLLSRSLLVEAGERVLLSKSDRMQKQRHQT